MAQGGLPPYAPLSMKKVLFIGNSLTYFHDIPAMIQHLCCFRQNALHAVMLTYGGYYLDQFLISGSEAADRLSSLLESEKWDYVVLQDNSTGPVTDRERFLTACRKLCEKIRQNGAVPLFYCTWSYFDKVHVHPELKLDYETFFWWLQNAYHTAAEENGGICIEVGKAFHEAAAAGLYDTVIEKKDDHHPALGGSYLSALVFAKFFMGADFRPEWKPEGLSTETAQALRKICF